MDSKDTKQVTQVSLSPSIWVIDELLTDEQCQHLIRLAENRLEPSLTVDPATGEEKRISQRTSEQAFFDLNYDDSLAEIEVMIADLVERPVENGEPIQILRYEPGQEYEPHFDYFEETEPGSKLHLALGGQRYATVLLYLSDVEDGGETIFPNIGLVVTPKKGSAVVFYNLFDNGQPDPDTLHGSLPVKKGVKWVATKWVRQERFPHEAVNQSNPAESTPSEQEAQCPFHQGTGDSGHSEHLLNSRTELQSGADDFYIKVWRLHPDGVHIEQADKTLMGDAPSGAVRWCGPFTHANAYGFWIHSPIDIDITWHGGRSFEYEIINDYDNADVDLFKKIQSPDDKYQYDTRAKIDGGTVSEGVFSIWTGCAFQTPPGWSLMFRSVINKSISPLFKIQEGILETDWLPYDIWMNLLFLQQGKKLSLRRNSQMPVAQIIPVRREGYDRKWNLIESPMERSTSEGEAFYQSWVDYNYKKWIQNAKKDPYTYHAERARHLKKDRHKLD